MNKILIVILILGATISTGARAGGVGDGGGEGIAPAGGIPILDQTMRGGNVFPAGYFRECKLLDNDTLMVIEPNTSGIRKVQYNTEVTGLAKVESLLLEARSGSLVAGRHLPDATGVNLIGFSRDASAPPIVLIQTGGMSSLRNESSAAQALIHFMSENCK